MPAGLSPTSGHSSPNVLNAASAIEQPPEWARDRSSKSLGNFPRRPFCGHVAPRKRWGEPSYDGKGDRVIFSSRTIPGNEKAVGRVVNGLVGQGVDAFVWEGALTLPDDVSAPLVLVGPGTGIAPVRCVVRHVVRCGWTGHIAVFTGHRNHALDDLYGDEWAALEGRRTSSEDLAGPVCHPPAGAVERRRAQRCDPGGRQA